MKKIHNISISQKYSSRIHEHIKQLAEFYNIKCKIKYIDMSFGFPWNTCHYCLQRENKKILKHLYLKYNMRKWLFYTNILGGI